jgi:hypothetical protein
MSTKLPLGLKGGGYLVSSFSVLLLGIVNWKSASEDRLLFACLVLGMAASIVGMVMRWLAFLRNDKEKQEIERKAEANTTRT